MNIFHACDIRGIAGRELSDLIVRKIGLAIAPKLQGGPVVIGGDVRLSTPVLQHVLVEALTESGCQIIDIGTVATPMFYYALKITGAVGGGHDHRFAQPGCLQRL